MANRCRFGVTPDGQVVNVVYLAVCYFFSTIINKPHGCIVCISLGDIFNIFAFEPKYHFTDVRFFARRVENVFQQIDNAVATVSCPCAFKKMLCLPAPGGTTRVGCRVLLRTDIANQPRNNPLHEILEVRPFGCGRLEIRVSCHSVCIVC